MHRTHFFIVSFDGTFELSHFWFNAIGVLCVDCCEHEEEIIIYSIDHGDEWLWYHFAQVKFDVTKRKEKRFEWNQWRDLWPWLIKTIVSFTDRAVSTGNGICDEVDSLNDDFQFLRNVIWDLVCEWPLCSTKLFIWGFFFSFKAQNRWSNAFSEKISKIELFSLLNPLFEDDYT